MTEDPNTCDCEFCVAIRKAAKDHGIVNPIELNYLGHIASLSADIYDVMAHAEEHGFDMQRAAVDAALDQIFAPDQAVKSKLH